MSFTPNEQHAVGDTEAGVKGPVVLGRDEATGLIAPLLGSEGTASGNRAPLSSEPGRKGLLAWVSMIWNEIHNSIPSEVQGVGTAVTNAQTSLSNQINTGIPVFPLGQVGDGGQPFQPAVDENYDPDSFFNRYPLYLKAGTKNLKTAVEATVGLTDTELRASAIPVSLASVPAAPGVALDASVTAVTTSLGTDGAAPPVIAGTGVRGFLRAIYDRLVAGIGVTGTFWQATQPVSGTFFQATQPVSAATLPLPTGASTEATLALIKAKTDNLDVAISTRTKPTDTQAVSAASLPLPALAATSTKQSDGTQKTQVVDGSGNVQPSGDTNARSIKVDASATTQPISVASLPLPTGAATSAAQTTAQTSLGNIDTGLGTDGATPPTIPGTGVRGWLRSIYDKIALLVAVFPTTLDTNSGNKSASTLRVVLATDQPTNTNKIAVTATSDQSSHGTSDLAADDIIKQAGVTLSAPVATAPDGTQTAPVIRGLNRKSTTIETTTPLAGNAAFVGTWHDSNATGDNYVTAYTYSDKVGAAFTIEESDDTGNANLTRTIASYGGGPTAATLSWMVGVIRARWWRVKYTNGATLQTAWELTTCASSVAPDDILSNSTSGAALPQAKKVVVYVSGGAGVSAENNTASVIATAVNASGTGPQYSANAFHGGKFTGSASAGKVGWSYGRTPTVYQTVAATASGDTAIWTPASGNKFRLLKFKVQLTADAAQASGGRITIKLRDTTTDLGVTHVVYVPSAGGTSLNGSYDSGWIDLGEFGILSAAANNALNVNLSSALTAGVCNVITCGVED